MLPLKEKRQKELPYAAYMLFFGELILAYAAQGALEISGYIFPLGAGGDATLGVAQSLVINPTANVTYMFHSSIPPDFVIFRASGGAGFVSVVIIISQNRRFFRDIIT